MGGVCDDGLRSIMNYEVKNRQKMKQYFQSKTIWLFIHAAIILAISCIIALCFISSTKSLSFFAVLEESGDEPMSDMYMYVNSRKCPDRLDTTITFVNIDLCEDRLEIARLIEQIDSLNPKVIGLDVLFEHRKDSKEDLILENVIHRCKNLVVTCELKNEQDGNSDKYNSCNRNFFTGGEADNLTEGFVNLDSDGNSPVETFTPKLFLQNEESLDTLYCFAAQVARLYDKTAFQYLLKRHGNLEIIHFQPLQFYELGKNEMDDNKEFITGKIVLIGSFSEDLHKTPVNPQMRGMEIHAHIISTIIEKEKYINRLDNIWTKLINILLCYLFALFSWFVTDKIKKGIVIFIKLAQVAILLLAFFAGYYLFNHFRIDIAYTWTIIVMGVLILIVDIYHLCISMGSKWIIKLKKTYKNGKDS